MKLNEKIQYLRKQKGWTQEQLSDELGISRQALSKWELGTAVPDTVNVLKLSKLFGTSTDYLLDDEIDTLDECRKSVSADIVKKAKLSQKVVELIDEKGHYAGYILALRCLPGLIVAMFICYSYLSVLAGWGGWDAIWDYPFPVYIMPITAGAACVMIIAKMIVYIIMAVKLRKLESK